MSRARIAASYRVIFLCKKNKKVDFSVLSRWECFIILLFSLFCLEAFTAVKMLNFITFKLSENSNFLPQLSTIEISLNFLLNARSCCCGFSVRTLPNFNAHWRRFFMLLEVRKITILATFSLSLSLPQHPQKQFPLFLSTPSPHGSNTRET